MTLPPLCSTPPHDGLTRGTTFEEINYLLNPRHYYEKISILLSALCLTTVVPTAAQAQSEFKLNQETLSNPDNEPAPVFPVPSDRQLKWNETEFYAF